jgi:AcrR family transcriptional regulator
VGAVLEIVRECAPNTLHLPGAAEVAERAGVSERTVFRHFADLDSLFMAAASKLRPTHETYVGPRPNAPEVENRIAALVRLRSKLYEEIAPVRRVAIHVSHSQPVVVEQLAQAYTATRAQVAAVFAPELSRLDPKRRLLMLDALDLATSWSSWDTLRTIQGCSVDRARKVVTEVLTDLLAAVPKSRRR